MNDHHSPAPWVVGFGNDTGYNDEYYVQWTEVGPAQLHGDVNPMDVSLIAAAPELLHALIMVRDADDDCRSDGLKTIPDFARHYIDAVIAKAEGRA